MKASFVKRAGERSEQASGRTFRCEIIALNTKNLDSGYLDIGLLVYKKELESDTPKWIFGGGGRFRPSPGIQYAGAVRVKWWGAKFLYDPLIGCKFDRSKFENFDWSESCKKK